MTKKESSITSFISEMHRSSEVWDLNRSYQVFCSSGNYKKSKRTFERELIEKFFLKEYKDQKENKHLIKTIYKYWQKIIKSKRLLSIDAITITYNKKFFLFYTDNRGKKYWNGVANDSKKNIKASLEKLVCYTNQKVVFWSCNDLLNSFFELVEDNRSQTFNSELGTFIIPSSAYKKTLASENLFKTDIHINKSNKKNIKKLTHLDKLESEAIHIIRETVSEASNPVMLYSIGKDSAVMLHLAKKAFHPSVPPFPLLHVDTGWKFNEMYQFRDLMVKKSGMKLLIYKNKEGEKKLINPIDHGSEIHTKIMKTEALKQALDLYKFDFAFGGARRDEEKSRAKERILSFRSENHVWDPKNQRPELWNLYNYNKMINESARVFPISNWTEQDIWHYIYRESIPIVPLYFSKERAFVNRDGQLIMIDDDRLKLFKNEKIYFLRARFRTLGCYPLTAAIESEASSINEILLELLEATSTEREGRLIDSDSEGSMEKKKKEGYF